MKNSTILRVIVLGAIAIAGIIGMQAYWVLSTWNLNEEDFNKKASLALYRVACHMADLNEGELPARNVVNQRANNYYVVNIASEIDAEQLEYFLQKEVEALALFVDFEYAVYDCSTNEMVYGNYCSYTPGEKHHLELGNLPKDDKFTYYFSVKFPGRSGYLLGKMQLSIFLSGILLLVVLFFSYSMFVILRQKRLSQLQKDFINNMTHEFKTPISTIKIAADVFANDEYVAAQPRLSRYAQVIREQNQRLNRQVEKVLQLAKIEEGNFEIKKESIPLRPLLESTVESTSVQVEKIGGQLQSDLQIPFLNIEADRLHLTNILYNILDNAIKYCQTEPNIQLKAWESEEGIHISVQDNGIGIPPDQLSRVFNKFYRVPTGNVHRVKGFGLGLYYVKNICDAHGWLLRISSQPEQGTQVKITIPRLRPGWQAHWQTIRGFGQRLLRTNSISTN